MNTQTKLSNQALNYYPLADKQVFTVYSYMNNRINMWKTERQLKQELLNNSSVIFVYQMGKVGSMSTYLTLKKHLQNQAIYHIHNLNSEHFSKIWATMQLEKTYHAFTFGHSCMTKYLSEHIEEIKGQKSIKIITGVREPIARNISWFFQIIHCACVFPEFFIKYEKGLITMDDIIKKFWSQNFVYGKQYDWFEEELEAVFGIDIASMDFPKEKGYAIANFPDRNIELLVLKLEKLDSCLKEALETFLGVENLDCERLDRADFLDENDYLIYENLRKSLTFSDEYLEEIYDQPLVRHFYTDEEINKFKLKWSSQR
ncbi:MAG: AerL protein [Microcystis viridis Mv_BB_P_19951000_S69]|uniref:AerL protein n=1 Tax=Microcystis viridis Mv_BB_P_19951000_S68D TaxID=2486270 RepID=A0A552I6N6_MICVR|nr:MAG: AerL protein [Microcystis viridis Mv_BB_P_19951000_S69]TRU78243.1 MAG: AerL protein [Microcystis viridis Mv_BB_P_19951000_S68]TRU79119.1 MAG: AerL protein [Microcystis viridis Mv_BB_P_19951000_S68D]TRU90103.1 MAG: AerL protein [Microcystis viridis Mv_BB_P_19951000_S69D]